MSTPTMDWAAPGLRQIERFTTYSLHWGFVGAVAVTAIMLAVGTWNALDLPYLIAIAIGMWGGLGVLHSRLRVIGLLSPSFWDRVVPLATPRISYAAWLGGGLAATALGGFLLPTMGDAIVGVFVAFNASMLTIPQLVAPTRLPLWTTLLACIAGHVWRLPLDRSDGALLIPTLLPALLIGWMIVTSSRMLLDMLRTAKELDRARRDSARLAVAEERLRFSRDLHDVFGRTLSAVALKSELAAAQAERGRSEAIQTMREVERIASDALEEVRDVVRGYRDIDLTTEIAGARALLEASGIAVTTVSEGATSLPAPVLRTFAWVVREGATNILRHSSATSTRIALVHDAAEVRLSITNDRPNPGRSESAGSGLMGLTERLADVGGSLTSTHSGGSFTLTAVVDTATLGRLGSATSEKEMS